MAAWAWLPSGPQCGKNPFSNSIAIWPYLLFLAACWLSQNFLYFLFPINYLKSLCDLCPEFPVPMLKEFTLALRWGRVQTRNHGELFPASPVDTKIHGCSSALQLALHIHSCWMHGSGGPTVLCVCFYMPGHIHPTSQYPLSLGHSMSLRYNAKPLIKGKQVL